MMRRAMPWFVLSAVLVAALSMRGPIIAVTPVLPEITADLGLTGASAGMLTTAPVLMFAALTPLAALLIRRAGAETALLLSLCGVLAGTALRAIPGYAPMLAGMFVIGASITIGNVVIPVVIRRDVPPDRVATATAAYTATLNVGSLLTALGTVPLAELLGWSFALLAWGMITVLGVVLWSAHILRRRRALRDLPAGDASRRAGAVSIDPQTLTGPVPVIVERRMTGTMRRPIVWLLLASFSAQSAVYYAMSTWLPTILLDTTSVDAASAGALASIFQSAAIIGALMAPALMRVVGPVPSAVMMGGCFAVMVCGLLMNPSLAAVWASFGAVAHAAGFVLIFTALVRQARSDSEAATMSAVVQGGGYLFAATAAPALGALHESSGGWEIPLLVLLAVAVFYGVALTTAMVKAFGRS